MVVLVIAAHGDDEILGCGGTMIKHLHQGDEVHVVLLADGVSSRVGDIVQAQVDERVSAAESAHDYIGTTSLSAVNLPDNKLDTLPRLEIIQIIESYVYKLKPNIIYTHFSNDLNVDHRRVSEAVMTACRPKPGFFVNEIYQWENASSTEWNSVYSGPVFAPNTYVDIGEFLDRKLEALKFYDDEMMPWPHARSYEAVNYMGKYRGASVGLHAAEAFICVRKIK